MLHVRVLGSAAGGGFPQWNSAGPGCLRAREGDPAARPRSQTSLAVSADGDRWVLLNAAPELPAQIAATPALHPRPDRGIRNSPIAAVLLTGAEVDTVAGLLSLRERHPFAIHGSAQSLATLDANPIFRALNPAIVPRRPMTLDEAFAVTDAEDAPLGLTAEAFAVPGKVPLFAERDGDPGFTDDGETIGLSLRAGDGPTLLFIPGCAAVTPALRDRIAVADTLFFDGTLYHDDEMIRAGAGPKTGARMGHMSIAGPGGTLAALRGLPTRRRILIHLNNTNPVLLADSEARAHVLAEGWDVAEDGMELTL